MDLKSGYPYWVVKNGLPRAFPPLGQDLRCDVAVVGGGVTGALVADALASAGFDVVVLDRRDIGWGSTAASTALAQYEIDTPMAGLAVRYGEAAAALAYRACADTLPQLARLARSVRDVGYRRMRSLYLASRAKDVDGLQAEFALRRRHGLPVAWLGPGALRERFGIHAPAALLTDRAAGLDPYRTTHRLLARLQRRGAGVFDRTAVARLEPRARDVVLRTSGGCTVRATHVVLAAGYESQAWLRARVARNRSTYACATEPIDDALLGPLRDTMLWETARPYLYLRHSPEGRLLVGGEDDAVDDPDRRDARVGRKAATLLRKVHRMFPHLPLEPAFCWAGTFAETADGLPFFGPHPRLGPRVHFAMAYGGNGITYALLGAELIRARIERRAHPLAALCGFARLE
jgi:glycine/D-amino acid oxidase-like deaminating enzyme